MAMINRVNRRLLDTEITARTELKFPETKFETVDSGFLSNISLAIFPELEPRDGVVGFVCCGKQEGEKPPNLSTCFCVSFGK